MHEYSRDDFRDCLAGRRLVFVGDSTVRQVFWAAVKRLNSIRADEELMHTLVSDNPRHDIDISIDGIRLVFIWDPWLNSTGLSQELAIFDSEPSPPPPPESNRDAGQYTAGPDRSAALLLVGAPGLWAARNGEDNYFQLFERAIEAIRPYLKDRLEPDGAGQKSGYGGLKNHILVAPVQVPCYRKLSRARAEALTPSKINRMNAHLASLPARERSHIIFAYNEMTRPGTRNAFEDTGLHVREALVERKIDIAVNARCNQGLVRTKGHAHVETCCVSYPSPARGQRLVLFALVTASLPTVLSSLVGVCGPSILRRMPLSSPGQVRAALSTLSLVILYCYVADRTQLFPKSEKRISVSGLVTTLLASYGLSVLSLRTRRPGFDQLVGSGGTQASPAPAKLSRRTAEVLPGSPQYNEDVVFLPREVTEEWKGWMQVLLLALSFQQLSDRVWAYKTQRLLSSGYLFLSTYGHATYLLRTGDYSLRRVATVF